MFRIIGKLLISLIVRFFSGQGDPKGFRRLFLLIFEHKVALFFAIVFMLLYNLLNALPAWYAKDVVDALQRGRTPDLQRFALIGVGIFLIFATKGVFSYAHNFLLGMVSQRLAYSLRRDLYAHLQSLPFSFFATRPAGELISRFTSDLITLQEAIRVSVLGPLRDIPQILVFLGILIYRSWELFLVSMILIPIALGLISSFGRKYKRLTGRRLTSYGEMTALLMETIRGMRVVKAFGMEKYERGRFENANQSLYQNFMRSIRIQSYSNPMLETIGALAGGGIIMFGGYLIIHNHITSGDFVSFLLAFFMLNDPVKKLNGFNLQVQEGIAAADRIEELFSIPPKDVDEPGVPDLPVISRDLRIMVNSFAYEGQTEPVLRNIEIQVSVGEVIALVGSSGAGKTTLVNLIPRFFDLKDGDIFIDGRDIRNFSLSSLRKQVAVVTQEIFLFNDTVANNIAYGNIECPRDQVITAAKSAFAHDFIMAMPLGYDTPVGEGGIQLSGGQRQRLSIARALIKDAPILILDEATSALDSESEMEVQRAIDALLKDRTTIVIAHRLSTIRRANRIYAMEQGSVVESGRHEELLALDGIYKRLYEMQFRDEEAHPGPKFNLRRVWNHLVGGKEEPKE
ncbi:MAG: ABC transporter ATP-binding protein/permease [Deltaproteobacteria bacterium]|nr:ABC transporter ATP-binding protein/permease [Deltaproteobacteria bacterium]